MQVIAGGRLLRREHLDADTFLVDLDTKKLLVRLRDNTDPARATIEASVRTQCLAGERGAGDVRVRGNMFRYPTNQSPSLPGP